MSLPEPHITRYQRWLQQHRGLHFDSYDAMWRWSVSDLEAFWGSIWDYFDLQSPTPYTAVLRQPATMPGATWFDGAQLNYAQHLLRHADASHAAGHPAMLFANERDLAAGRLQQLSWHELRRQVASCAAALKAMGVQRGDRVCAVLPNVPQTIVVFLAAASMGAIWSVCSPDMGPVAVLDRFRQIEPKVLVACDGYRYGGVDHDRRGVLAEVLAALPSVQHVALWRNLDANADVQALATPARHAHDLQRLLAGDVGFAPEWLPFDHPLWVVYSSGTTGLPKPIVHGHGGVMVEMLKMNALHNDVGPSAGRAPRTRQARPAPGGSDGPAEPAPSDGDRYHWYSSTGWIMWNAQVGALLGGTTICLFDGSPAAPSAGSGAPDWSTLWRFAGQARCTFFGAGAAFYASCLKAGVEPQAAADLSALRAVGSTGSPLSVEGYRWIRDKLPKVDGRDIWLAPISGGTDFGGAFVGGLPTLPVIEGEMQCRCLGASVEAWSEPDANGVGKPLIDEVGELVCTKPMPSMPLYFWGDANGKRYHDSYFDMYPGIWRHGDWIKITKNGGAIIYGRSDATINRHGIRMGTAELYRAVEALPEVLDSLVVDLEYLGRESWMPLFVVLRDGVVLDDALMKRIKQVIREALSARHVPNDVYQVSAIPRTLSGKKMELPVKKLLLGAPADSVLKRDAMANADCVDWFVELARQRAASTTAP
jgi:acetoacetyl-CoA synthetase